MNADMERAVKELARLLQYGGYRCHWEPQEKYIRLTIITPDGHDFIVRLYSVNDAELARDMFLTGYMTTRRL